MRLTASASAKMQRKFVALMKEFAKRKGLRAKVQLEFRDDRNRPRIFCDQPEIVARFWSQLRQEVSPKQLLIRGQTCDHPGMTPGLFRPPSHTIPVSRLLEAESAFANEVVKAFPNNRRFHRADLPSLLQHYGFKTSWLDVVDNLWTAVWFATRSVFESDGFVRSKSDNKSGWIYFLRAGANGTAIDLRQAHQGLSLRPHVQAGWSMKGTKTVTSNLEQFVVATVEFPVDDRWRLAGHLGSAEFFFPPPNLDDTLSRLASPGVDQLAEQIEERYNLPRALGRLFPRVDQSR